MSGYDQQPCAFLKVTEALRSRDRFSTPWSRLCFRGRPQPSPLQLLTKSSRGKHGTLEVSSPRRTDGNNVGSSLLCVGNGKIELSGDEVYDGDQIPGCTIASGFCLDGLYQAVDTFEHPIGDARLKPPENTAPVTLDSPNRRLSRENN